MGKNRKPVAKQKRRGDVYRKEVEFKDETSVRHEERIEKEKRHEQRHPTPR